MNDMYEADQIRLPFQPPRMIHPLEVLDLFAGIGGMSLGFQAENFTVTGVDKHPVAGRVFDLNSIGDFVEKDLENELVLRKVPVVTGGPPCRPWSAVNVQRRGRKHDDHVLLERFFQHLMEIRPSIFIMENVPPLSGDNDYNRLIKEMERRGYSVNARILRYSDFGAATARRRLFTVGVQDSAHSSAMEFFKRLEREKHTYRRTVWDEIEWLRDKPYGAVPDHHWSQLRTIDRYDDKYQTGEFGWRKLDRHKPAPSFGSIAKTYILHPDAGEGTFPRRVLSVREVLCIMGFTHSFRFPDGTSLTNRYHMVANAVSPIIAQACARVVKGMLLGDA